MTDPIPDETVEAVARTLHRLDHEDEDWETAPPRRRDVYTSDARAAVTAAAPLIAAQATNDLRAGIEALRDEWREQASHSARALHDQGHDYDIGYLRARNVVCADHADALDALLRGA